MSAIDSISPKARDRNIKAIMGYMQDMGYCTQKTMADQLGVSPSSAGTYLNEAVRRGQLVVNKGKWPKQYTLPSHAKSEKKALFEKTSKNQPLTVYMDEGICNKLKALSILRKGSMYGGQSRLIATLIEREFEKIPVSYHENLENMILSAEKTEELKSSIPMPVEWSK